MITDFEERIREYDKEFWLRVVKSKRKNGCWLFLNAKGILTFRSIQVTIKGESLNPAVYSLEKKLGRRLKDGFISCHHCDNPPCVNPAHLFEGTYSDNMQDMLMKGRNNYWTKRALDKAIWEENKRILRTYQPRVNHRPIKPGDLRRNMRKRRA